MKVTIALAGNPNSGKTTMFNDLTGSSQYVGNWPGVTVEKKEGVLRGNKDVAVVDLPGIYSLSPYTLEEVVSREYLLGDDPGAILNLVDGTNIERNLYLTLQLMEVGLPMVVALNMADLVKKNGDKIDTQKLAGHLGCQVVATSALRGEGTKEAAQAAAALAADRQSPRPRPQTFSQPVEDALAAIAGVVGPKVPAGWLRWYTVKLFERDEKIAGELALQAAEADEIEAATAAAEAALDDDAASIITSERYEAIADIIAASVQKRKVALTHSDKIDRIVTNRILALPIFVAVMFVVYFLAIMTVGTLATDWTNDVLFGEIIQGNVAGWMEGAGVAEWLTSLVVDGIIGGVGAVLGFVPQMIVLFLLLSFLEGCGYMARVAFIMDRIFRKFGLSGKSFIPMLISSGCAVPGIMATKTIENEKDRRMTIITTSFIPCGAKLPIIALIVGAVFGGAWWVSPLIYFIGVGGIIVSGIILKKTKLFAGDPAPFVMELPQYHLPAAKSILLSTWERVRSFIVRAGTVIFASSIAIWFLLSFGFESGFGMVDAVENSLLAGIGGFIAPVFAPLGFGNWQATVGTLTGLLAKEEVVSTLAIIQGLDDAVIEGILDDTTPLWAYMSTVLPSFAAGLSFLIFNMLCAPCFAAIGAIRRQMMSARWTAFAIAYQTVFAYAIALMVFQFGSLFAGGGFGAGTVAAIAVLAVMLFLLFRPDPNHRDQLNRAAARG
ncbi:ferrous iron transport protein B [Ruminococcaceae bacterium OttesenSCG-928-A11]|nr:ferrous iron transport protein B [Ruminococcaceae bacterium OttesenSCG-928-A11]